MNDNPFQPPRRRFSPVSRSDSARHIDRRFPLPTRDWGVVVAIAVAAGFSGGNPNWVSFNSTHRWVNLIPTAIFLLGPLMAVAYVIAICDRQMARQQQRDQRPPFPSVASVARWFLLLVAGYVVFSSSCVGTSLVAMDLGFSKQYQPSDLALGTVTFVTTLLACVAVIPMHLVLRRLLMG